MSVFGRLNIPPSKNSEDYYLVIDSCYYSCWHFCHHHHTTKRQLIFTKFHDKLTNTGASHLHWHSFYPPSQTITLLLVHPLKTYCQNKTWKYLKTSEYHSFCIIPPSSPGPHATPQMTLIHRHTATPPPSLTDINSFLKKHIWTYSSCLFLYHHNKHCRLSLCHL